MKRLFTIIAALAALCLASCERTDPYSQPDEAGNVRTEDERFWSVVGQLVDMDDVTPDYKDKTFKPVIGNPDNGDESVRVVLVNSLEEAVGRYNDIVGANIDENTTEHTFNDPVVGKLVWTKSADSRSWATVDVAIPAVPTLQKIIYRSPEQGDANGSVGDDGSAYYRFGDVIQRTRDDDGVTEYWVCVRPAFDKEGKGDSHWISVSPLPEENIWPYNSPKNTESFIASNGFKYSFPYSIRTGLEWYQDLAEMLFAIYYPDEWMNNIINYSGESMMGPTGLRIFKGFHKSNIKYHNVAYWTNVQNAWKQKGIARRVFGLSDQELAAALKSERGLHFLYKSYSWSTKFSNKPTLYQAQYTYTTSNNEKRNMRNETTGSISSQVVDPKKTVESNINYPFDIKREVTVSKPYVQKQNFFGDNDPRWIIRYAEGDELAANGKWDPQQPISGFEQSRGGELYRYYKDVFKDKNLTDEAEISELRRGVVNDSATWDRSTYTGEHHYEFGDVFRDEEGKYWFVISTSGGDGEWRQKSPYAEIISFEGIQTSNSNAVATNIVTLDQARRASIVLWFLVQEYYKHPDGVIESIAKNIKNNTGVDLGKLIQELVYTNNSGKLVPLESWSVAYRDQSSSKQKIIRFVVDPGPGNEWYTSMWTKYPASKPVTIDEYKDLPPASFSNLDIYLQDVAESSLVNSYGDDPVARAPLFTNTAVPRPYRTSVESRAKDVTNYFYGSSWNNGSNPFGMWNEPVLFFRMTVLYDRGGEYSTKTADGKTLTLVSKTTFPDYMPSTDTWIEAAWPDQTPTFRHLNGNPENYPTWQSVWGTK